MLVVRLIVYLICFQSTLYFSLLSNSKTSCCLFLSMLLLTLCRLNIGKGQCTKHALKCGGGCGIFFLLQECKTLIIHNKRAAYVHSPFVDTHGETGEYRGKPLNLNIDRYSVLQELWFGHLVRQKVISERETSRQFILNNYY